MKEFYPKVSIIIPACEGGQNLEKTINSALNQSYQNTEIILITSNLNNTEIIDKYKDRIKCFNKNNGNIPQNINFGIGKMTGEYFSILIPGNEYYSNKIEREIITLNLLDDKNTIIISNYDIVDTDNIATTVSIQYIKKIKEYPELAIIKRMIYHSAILISKKVIDSCGKFNEKMPYFFDYDKYLDIIKLFNFHYISDVLVKINKFDDGTMDLKENEDELLHFYDKMAKILGNKKIIDIFGNIENYYKEIIITLEKTPFKNVMMHYKKELNSIIYKKLEYKPLISVLIPVYNGSNYLEEALESVLKQTYSNYEIIVVNDGSNDEGKTKKIALKYENKIRYFEKENGGVASALNYGISKANGDYISWLSHDDIYNENKLLKQVEVLNKLKKKETILFSNFELINENSVVYSKTNFNERLTNEELENDILPVLKGTTNGCTMLIPKSILESSGGFDESKKTTNDYIMWFNIFSKYPKKFIPDYLIKYRIHSEQDTKKSPVYISESEDMWTKVFNALDEKYIKKLNYEPLVFYSEFYVQMKENGLTQTASILLKKYNDLRKEKAPIISVIMPCYNSSSYLREAVDSILNQTFMPLELICVDDNSSDNTYKLLLELQKNDDRIIVTKNTCQKGVSGAMNTGLKMARGKYIARMDSDDICDHNKLKIQYEFLKNNPSYGVCSTNISLMDKKGEIFSKNHYSISDAPIEWQFLWTNPIPCAPCMYRKKILDGVQFNETFSTAEDYEFLSHIVDKKIFFIDKDLYCYRIHDTSLFQKSFIKTMINSQLIAKKYYQRITKNKKIPAFFELLTSYSTFQSRDKNISHYEMIEFLMQTLKEFQKYYNWNEDETKKAMNYILNPYDNFIINTNITFKKDESLEKEYNDILNSLSWKVTKPLRNISKQIRKIAKIKNLIWRKNENIRSK